jgi:YVTN family beta-propeller protein
MISRLGTFLLAVLLPIGPVAPAAEGGESGTLIVLNKAEATASLIDLSRGSAVAVVPTGEGPHEVAVSPDGRFAVVANYGRQAAGATLTVIDVPGARVEKTVDLGEYRRPHGIAFLPGTAARVAVTAEEDRALLTVDLESGEVLSAVKTDQDVSHMVAILPSGARAFVANIGSGTVTAVDLTKGTRIASLPTGAGAEGIDVTPDGTEVWVTNRSADTVTILDASSLDPLATLGSKSFPIRVRITPDGRHALVSNAKSGEVAVFEVSARREIRRIPMRHSAATTEGRLFGDAFGDSPVPIGILVHPSGKTAYVANANADVIAIVDLRSWTVTGSIRAGKEPDGLGYSKLRVRSSKAPPSRPQTRP